MCKQPINLPAPQPQQQLQQILEKPKSSSTKQNLLNQNQAFSSNSSISSSLSSTTNQFSFGLQQINKPTGPPPPFGSQNVPFSVPQSQPQISVPQSQPQFSVPQIQPSFLQQQLQQPVTPSKTQQNIGLSMHVPLEPPKQQAIPQQQQKQQQPVQQIQPKVQQLRQESKVQDTLNIESKIQSFTIDLNQFKEKFKQMSDLSKGIDDKLGRKTTATQNTFNELDSDMRVSYRNITAVL